MSIEAAFFPQATVNIAATTISQNVALPATTLGPYQTADGDSVLIYNSGATIAFVEFGGNNSVVASPLLSMPIPPGMSRLIGCGQYVSFVAAIMLTGTGTIYFSRGKGHNY